VLMLVLGRSVGCGPYRPGRAGVIAKSLLGRAFFQGHPWSGGKAPFRRRRIGDRRSLRDSGEVGTMGGGGLCPDLSVGRKPHLLAAGAADRPPSRPERGRSDLIGGSAVRAGDQHRRFAPAKGTLLHASRPFVNGPETKGKPKGGLWSGARPHWLKKG